MSGTAVRRALVALLVAALGVVAYLAYEVTSRSTPARADGAAAATEEQPEIGTAILIVRNADGSVTTTERR